MEHAPDISVRFTKLTDQAVFAQSDERLHKFIQVNIPSKLLHQNPR